MESGVSPIPYLAVVRYTIETAIATAPASALASMLHDPGRRVGDISGRIAATRFRWNTSYDYSITRNFHRIPLFFQYFF